MTNTIRILFFFSVLIAISLHIAYHMGGWYGVEGLIGGFCVLGLIVESNIVD